MGEDLRGFKNSVIDIDYHFKGTDLDPHVNEDDEMENDMDSFDEAMSQVSEREYRKPDSLDEFITENDELRSQADELRSKAEMLKEQEYLKAGPSSANSKVKDWLENKENQIVGENFQVERKKTPKKRFKFSKAQNSGNNAPNQRQDYLFQLFSRQQDTVQDICKQQLEILKKEFSNDDQN